MISQPRSVVYCGGTVSRVTGPALGSTGFAVAADAPSFSSLSPALPPQVASSRSRARKTTPPTRTSRTIFCLMDPSLDLGDLVPLTRGPA